MGIGDPSHNWPPIDQHSWPMITDELSMILKPQMWAYIVYEGESALQPLLLPSYVFGNISWLYCILAELQHVRCDWYYSRYVTDQIEYHIGVCKQCISLIVSSTGPSLVIFICMYSYLNDSCDQLKHFEAVFMQQFSSRNASELGFFQITNTLRPFVCIRDSFHICSAPDQDTSILSICIYGWKRFHL